MKKFILLLSLAIACIASVNAQVVNHGDSNYIYYPVGDSCPTWLASPTVVVHRGTIHPSTGYLPMNWGTLYPINQPENIFGIALTADTILQGRKRLPMKVMLKLYAISSQNGGNLVEIDSVVTDCTRPFKQFVYSAYNTVAGQLIRDTVTVFEALFKTNHVINEDSIVVTFRAITSQDEIPYCWDEFNSIPNHGMTGLYQMAINMDNSINYRYDLGVLGPIFAIRNRECPQMTDPMAVQYDANHMQLSWPSVSEASSYSIEYGISGHLLGDGMTVTNIYDTTYLLTLDPGYQYDIYVSAYCDQMDQYGMPSMVSAVMSDTLLCPVVEGLSASPQGAEVHFVWDTVSCHSLYQLAYCPYHLSPDSAAKVPTSEYELYIDGVFDTNIYYAAYVRGKCRHQCNVHDTLFWGPWIDPVYFYTGSLMPDTSGTHGHESITNPTRMRMDFGLQPNPAQGRVEVVLPDGVEKATITLMDASGKQVMKQTVHRNAPELNLKRLAKGVYFVTLTAKEGTSTQKLVVE